MRLLMSFALTTICTCICRYLSSAWSTILIYDAYTVPYCTWFERKKEGEYAMPNHAQPRFMSGHFDPLWWKMFYKCASPELWCPIHQSTSAKHVLDISHQLNQAAVKHKTCGFSKQLWIVGHAVIWFERKVHNIFPATSDTETNWRTFIYKWNPFLWHFQASSMDVPIVETHRQVASNAVEKCAKIPVEAKLPRLSLNSHHSTSLMCVQVSIVYWKRKSHRNQGNHGKENIEVSTFFKATPHSLSKQLRRPPTGRHWAGMVPIISSCCLKILVYDPSKKTKFSLCRKPCEPPWWDSHVIEAGSRYFSSNFKLKMNHRPMIT